jgi:hypothetical protein
MSLLSSPDPELHVHLDAEELHLDAEKLHPEEQQQHLDGFGLSEELVTSPTHKPKATTSVDFDGLLSPSAPLVLHEDLAKGNGGQAWPAGMILARYLLRTKRDALRKASSMSVAIHSLFFSSSSSPTSSSSSSPR